MKIALQTLVLGISILLCSCNAASKKDLSDAKENLHKANRDLQQAAKDSLDAAREKTIAQWKTFNEKSEDAVAALTNEIKQLQKTIATADQKENARLKRELGLNRDQLKVIRDKLRERNSEFENGMLKFDDSIELKNESFQREFNYDMDELDKAVKDLFKNNMK